MRQISPSITLLGFSISHSVTNPPPDGVRVLICKMKRTMLIPISHLQILILPQLFSKEELRLVL